MTFTRLYYNLYINHSIYTAERLPITGGAKVLKVGDKIASGACENFFRPLYIKPTWGHEVEYSCIIIVYITVQRCCYFHLLSLSLNRWAFCRCLIFVVNDVMHPSKYVKTNCQCNLVMTRYIDIAELE
jgi:hypothetical protein